LEEPSHFEAAFCFLNTANNEVLCEVFKLRSIMRQVFDLGYQ